MLYFSLNFLKKLKNHFFIFTKPVMPKRVLTRIGTVVLGAKSRGFQGVLAQTILTTVGNLIPCATLSLDI